MFAKIKTVHLAWLVLACYILHLLEEFYAGGGLAAWLNEHLSASLSERNFLLINFFGLLLFVSIALMQSFGREVAMLVSALGILLLINGLIHLGMSIYTMTYSPGTVSGIILYLPMGIITHKKLWNTLKIEDKIGAVSIGVLIQVIAFSLAMSL